MTANKLSSGGPAFPCRHDPTPEVGMWEHEGMTLRDYFAARALQGMAAQIFTTQGIGLIQESCRQFDEQMEGRISFIAYKLADGMLKAREQA